MASNSFVPARSAYSRVFIIEGRARPDHEPDYKSCLRAGTLEQSFGDVERIECPDPDSYGQFIEVGEIQAAEERPTTQLMGRYPAEVASDLLRLAKLRCNDDVHIHFGKCTDPRLFNTFTKAVVFEKSKITNYATEDLGALASDENAAVNETGDLSGREVYEVLPLSWQARANDVVVNPMVDVVICSTPSCGDCDDPDAGCEKIYAVSGSTGGSPGTGPEVIYSIDTGATFAADEITTLETTDDAGAIACLGDYVVVTSHSADALEYKLKATINAGTAGAWTEITTGIVAAGSPTDAWSVGDFMFVVGDAGYVYGTADPTAGVTVLDAGVATTENLAAVHALDDQFAVAVGANGAVIYTENRTTWTAATAPTANNLQAVWIKSETEWWVGDDAGTVYYTLDGGQNWTTKGQPVTFTAINDIAFNTDSVGVIAGTIAGPAGRITRTFDGGYSWVSTPEKAGSSIPAADDYDAIAACVNDANFTVAVGLADDGADGIIVVGQD